MEQPLVDVELSALRAWLRILGTAQGPLFLSPKRHAISRRQIHRLMWRYSVLADNPWEKAHLHAIKHSCVTHLPKLLCGNLIEILDHVGHADPRYTMLVNDERLD